MMTVSVGRHVARRARLTDRHHQGPNDVNRDRIVDSEEVIGELDRVHVACHYRLKGQRSVPRVHARQSAESACDEPEMIMYSTTSGACNGMGRNVVPKSRRSIVIIANALRNENR